MQGKNFPIRCRSRAAHYGAPTTRRAAHEVRTKSAQLCCRLRARLARKIALANRQSLPPQNVVGRRGVEIKIGLRKGQQEILRGEIKVAIAERKAHVAADKSVDFGRFNR